MIILLTSFVFVSLWFWWASWDGFDEEWLNVGETGGDWCAEEVGYAGVVGVDGIVGAAGMVDVAGNGLAEAEKTLADTIPQQNGNNVLNDT